MEKGVKGARTLERRLQLQSFPVGGYSRPLPPDEPSHQAARGADIARPIAWQGTLGARGKSFDGRGGDPLR